MSRHDIFVITFVSNSDHTYIFRYKKSTAREMLKQLGIMAANPELDLTWQDAFQIGNMIRKHIDAKFPN